MQIMLSEVKKTAECWFFKLQNLNFKGKFTGFEGKLTYTTHISG